MNTKQCPYTKVSLQCSRVQACLGHDCMTRKTAEMLAKVRARGTYLQRTSENTDKKGIDNICRQVYANWCNG